MARAARMKSPCAAPARGPRHAQYVRPSAVLSSFQPAGKSDDVAIAPVATGAAAGGAAAAGAAAAGGAEVGALLGVATAGAPVGRVQDVFFVAAS